MERNGREWKKMECDDKECVKNEMEGNGMKSNEQLGIFIHKSGET